MRPVPTLVKPGTLTSRAALRVNNTTRCSGPCISVLLATKCRHTLGLHATCNRQLCAAIIHTLAPARAPQLHRRTTHQPSQWPSSFATRMVKGSTVTKLEVIPRAAAAGLTRSCHQAHVKRHQVYRAGGRSLSLIFQPAGVAHDIQVTGLTMS